MITIVFIIFIIGAIIGGIYLAMASGTKGGRHRQSSKAVVHDQQDDKDSPRASGID